MTKENEEYKLRVIAFQKILQEKGIDGSFILDRVSLFYFYGTIPGGIGYIPASGEAILLVRRGIERAINETPFRVIKFSSFRKLQDIFKEHNWSKHQLIGMEFDRIPVALFNKYRKLFTDKEFVDISSIIKSLRIIKSEFEIEILKEAGRRAASSYKQIPTLFQDKMPSELELMADFEAIMRKNGHQGLVRMHSFNGEIWYGVIATGNSANANVAFDGPIGTPGLYPAAPFACSLKKIDKNEPILVDVVFGYKGYYVDQTRLFVVGKLLNKLINAYQCALEIQTILSRLMVPEQKGETLYEKAIEIVKQHHLIDSFMGFGNNKVSFVGHGVGLELDELPLIAPRYSTPFKNNMVIALEPKFFFENLGGVGLENTFRITDKGGEKLIPLSDDITIIP